MAAPEITDELRQTWSQLGELGSRTRIRSDGTIVPTDQPLPEALLKALQKVVIAEPDEPVNPDLILGDEIGRGGMAMVHRARQMPIRRDVAIKRLREDLSLESAKGELLREALIVSQLEHPNILPIYDIRVDAEGDPVLVMKRIDGVCWWDIINDPNDPDYQRFGHFTLEWHLQTMVQVTHAISYAHAKGIIHRDIKPENVMIGEFGEVYVLDWGIAVALDDRYGGQLPTRADVKTVVGTPAYLAPEMTEADGNALSTATDVYLLGSTLHEILTGEPPHQGDTVVDKMLSAAQSVPKEYPDNVPRELAGICRRAMARRPEERYDDVGEMREALLAFLDHRSSMQVAGEAFARFEALKHLIADAAPEDIEDELQINSLFGECRFGFKQALQMWPDNPEARQGLQEALETMAHFEIGRGSTAAAASLISELPEPRPDLLADLQRMRAQEGRRLQRIREVEGSAGSGWAVGLMMVVILAWAGGYGARFWLAKLNVYVMDTAYMAIFGVIVAGSSAVLALLLRSRLSRNRSSRWLTAAALILAAAMASDWTFVWLQGLPSDATVAHGMAITTVVLGLCSLLADVRLLTGALAFVVSYAVIIYEPRGAPVAYGVAALITGLSALVAWRPSSVIADPDAYYLADETSDDYAASR